MAEPPISYSDLKGLFEWLDRPDPPPCEHGYKETTEFLTARGLPVESTLKWLREYGGYCDCEVIYNVANDWGDTVGFVGSE
jgi:hypothetical protein